MANEIEDFMLTTVDNPFDPFEDYNNWLKFDETSEYYTNQLLARITKSSDELSDADEAAEILTAMKEIVAHDPLNVYIIIGRDHFNGNKQDK